MDFNSIKTVAVVPFANLSRDTAAADRVRNVFANQLQATDTMYVLPYGEVSRGLARSGVANPAALSTEEVVKLAGLLKVDAVVGGVVSEYGEIRSTNSTGNVVSVSIEMYDGGTGKLVFSASTTNGGIGMGARLLGGGAAPLTDVTEEAVHALLAKMFK
jgi:hypothetical protein